MGQRLFTFISIFFFLTLVLSKAISRNDAHISSLFRRQNEDNLHNCQPSCELGGCGGSSCSVGGNLRRRSSGELNLHPGALFPFHIDEEDVYFNLSESKEHHLEKRLFRYSTRPNNPANVYTGGRDPLNGESNTYLPEVHQGRENGHFGRPLGLDHADARGNPIDERAVSVERYVESLVPMPMTGNAFQIMSGGIHGCTVVWLVSRRAVWGAHFWETYSNNKPNVDDDPANSPYWLQRVVYHAIGRQVPRRPHPGNYKPYIQPIGPPITANLYNQQGDDTKLYIYSPAVPDAQTTTSGGPLAYRRRVAYLQNAIYEHLTSNGGIIPNRDAFLVAPISYVRLDYTVPEPGEPPNPDLALINNSYRGMTLFQWDPNSDGQGLARWRLWNEHLFARGP